VESITRRGIIVLAENKKHRRYRPLSLRKQLYRRVLELRRQGLSYGEIQKRILEETGEHLSRSTISQWLRRIHTPYGDGVGYDGEDRRTHKLRPCPELAYVIAAELGDGYTHYEGDYHYVVGLAARDYDFVEEFARCVAIALGREKPYKPYWDKNLGRWVTKIYSKELFYLLKKPVDLERIRPYIECSKECMAAFLRGLADAEGSANKDEKHLGHVSIYNNDLRLIECARSLLKALGIFAKIYKQRKKKSTKIDGRIVKRNMQITYRLSIHRKADIIKFREIISFTIKRKQEVLERVK